MFKMLGLGELFSFLLLTFILAFKLFGLAVSITLLIVLIAAGLRSGNLNGNRLDFFSYVRRKQGYWNRQGVQGPPPNILMGNALDFLKGMHVADLENKKKYGDTYCQYMFGYNDLVSTDLELIKQVLVKDFWRFPNRMVGICIFWIFLACIFSRLFKIYQMYRNFFKNIFKVDANNETSLGQNGVTLKQDEDWKRIRSQISPAFTSAKMQKVLTSYGERKLVEHGSLAP